MFLYPLLLALDGFHMNRRIAHDIVQLSDTLEDPSYSGTLGESTSVSKELKYLLMMDYIEELLVLVFESDGSGTTPKLSVCMMEVLLSYCWNYDYMKV